MTRHVRLGEGSLDFAGAATHEADFVDGCAKLSVTGLHTVVVHELQNGEQKETIQKQTREEKNNNTYIDVSNHYTICVSRLSGLLHNISTA